MVSADFSGANTSQQDQFQAIKVTWLSMDLGSQPMRAALSTRLPWRHPHVPRSVSEV